MRHSFRRHPTVASVLSPMRMMGIPRALLASVPSLALALANEAEPREHSRFPVSSSLCRRPHLLSVVRSWLSQHAHNINKMTCSALPWNTVDMHVSTSFTIPSCQTFLHRLSLVFVPVTNIVCSFCFRQHDPRHFMLLSLQRVLLHVFPTKNVRDVPGTRTWAPKPIVVCAQGW